MKTLHKILLSVSIIALLFTVGCAGTPVKLDYVDQPKKTDFDFTKGRTLEASASGFQLLLLIPININDRQERAYQILQGQAGGDYITDIKIKESWAYAFIGTIYKTTLQATAYPRK